MKFVQRPRRARVTIGSYIFSGHGLALYANNLREWNVMRAPGSNKRFARVIAIGTAAIALGGGGVALAANASADTVRMVRVATFGTQAECEAFANQHYPNIKWDCSQDGDNGNTVELSIEVHSD